jgi:hypothetical protein
MTPDEIVEKYGNIELTFVRCYKSGWKYENSLYELIGNCHDRPNFEKVETVWSLCNELENVEFTIKGTNKTS